MATRYWVTTGTTGGNGNWTDSQNWSATSGGAAGASAPTSADSVIFNANSGAILSTLNTNFSILGLTMSNFTGTLAFGTNVISVVGSGTPYVGSSTYSVTGTPVISVDSNVGTTITISPGSPSEANSISFIFTAGSYVLTFLGTTGETARNVTFASGFGGSWAARTTNNTIYGSLTLGPNAAFSYGASTGSLNFGATSGTKTITSNGKTFDGPIGINGSGGTFQLADALLMGTSRAFTHTAGTLDLNGKTLTVGTSYTTAAGTKVLTFNGGTLVCPAVTTTAFNNAAPTGFSTVAGTGTGKISMTGATAKTFVGGGSTYNCTLSNDGAGALTITGSNTFTTIANGVQPTTFSFTAATTTTVTNWNVSGISGSSVAIQSATAATHTLSKASGTVLSQYVTIANSIATGGATWYADFNSTSSGGTSGWIFGTFKYWVGGTGNWSTSANWSASSGGAGGAGIILPDSATFNNLSGTGISTVDSNVTIMSLNLSSYGGTLNFGTNSISLASSAIAFTQSGNTLVSGTPVINITNSNSAGTTTVNGSSSVTEANSISFNITAGNYPFTFGASSRIRSLNFTGFSGTLTTTSLLVYGDLNLGSVSSVVANTNAIEFRSTNATTRTITSNGVVIDLPVLFNGANGSWQLVDALTMGSTRTLTHTNGTIDLNGKTLTVGTRYTTAAGTKNLTFNAGTLVCPNGNINSFNNAIPTGYTTTAGTGTGKINMTATAAKTFVGGGSTFNCTVSNGGTGLLTISGSNTIDTVTTTSGSIAITGSNTITTISNGVQPVTFTFTAATTQTITNWNVSGTAGNLVTIVSSIAGTAASLSKSSGTVSADYLSIKDSTATGGAAWYAGANSTNVSGNSGWIFTAPPANNYTITALNGSYTLNGQSIGIYRNRSLTSAYGSYSLAGQSATLSRGFLLSPQNGLYSITGQAIDITYTPTPPVTGPTQYFIEIRSFTQSRRI